MSSAAPATNGSSVSTLEQEVEVLRQEVCALCDRVRELEIRLPPPTERASTASSTTSSAEVSGTALGADRIAAAKDIGRWIDRCLKNQPRGLSGRQRIPQASRLYLVVRGAPQTSRSSHPTTRRRSLPQAHLDQQILLDKQWCICRRSCRK